MRRAARTTVETIAGWAAGLREHPERVPRHVLGLARVQRRSVFGALAAGAGLPQVARMAGTVRGGGVAARLYDASVATMALDFDDYVCFAHPGHSAVLVPVLLGAETGSDGIRQLVAQVAADEVGARLGGACLLGPLNGQMIPAVHAAGSALAAGLLLGLDRDRLAHALALSLHAPPFPDGAGFVGSPAKLVTAADPILVGLRAARLAAAGTDGPLGVLERNGGFLATHADAPLHGLLGGLGRSWALETLSVKPYPGCAYLTAAVDALRRLLPLDVMAVERVRVAASAPTLLMEELSLPFVGDEPIDPVTVTFSVRLTLALALVSGDIAPRRLTRAWLAEHASELREVTRRIDVVHDRRLSLASAASFARLLPPRRLVEDAGPLALVRALARRGGLSGLVFGGGTLDAPGRSVVEPLPGEIRAALHRRDYWDPRMLSSFRMVLPAAVTVMLRDGRRRAAVVHVPPGAAGHARHPPHRVAAEKLAAYGPGRWGDDGYKALARGISADDADLARFVAQA